MLEDILYYDGYSDILIGFIYERGTAGGGTSPSVGAYNYYGNSDNYG